MKYAITALVSFFLGYAVTNISSYQAIDEITEIDWQAKAAARHLVAGTITEIQKSYFDRAEFDCDSSRNHGPRFQNTFVEMLEQLDMGMISYACRDKHFEVGIVSRKEVDISNANHELSKALSE